MMDKTSQFLWNLKSMTTTFPEMSSCISMTVGHYNWIWKINFPFLLHVSWHVFKHATTIIYQFSFLTLYGEINPSHANLLIQKMLLYVWIGLSQHRHLHSIRAQTGNEFKLYTTHERANWPANEILCNRWHAFFFPCNFKFVYKKIVVNCIQTGVAYPFI